MTSRDYEWAISPSHIIFDQALDIDKLGWKHGDFFKITNVNGRAMLVKLDHVEQFSMGHAVNLNK